MIDIKISWSKEQELRKLLFTLAQFKRAFFQNQNFFLLTPDKESNIDRNTNLRTCILEPAILNALKDFDWNSFDEEFWYREYFKADLSEYNFFYNYISDIEVSLEIDKNQLTVALEKLFEICELRDINVHIYPVKNGHPRIFTLNYDNKIRIYPRSICNLYDIVNATLASIVRTNYPDRPFKNYQLVYDFFLKHTIMKNYIDATSSEYYPEEITISEELLVKSLRNYSFVNMSLRPIFNVVKENRINQINVGVINYLTKNEEKLLALLVKNKNKVLSLDSISSEIWGSDQSTFSLQAITKLIERLRKKLRTKGRLKKDIIFTKPKKGYILVD